MEKAITVTMLTTARLRATLQEELARIHSSVTVRVIMVIMVITLTTVRGTTDIRLSMVGAIMVTTLSTTKATVGIQLITVRGTKPIVA